MPYCSTCGTKVGDRDAFCAKCGAKQPLKTPPAASLSNLSSRNASLLCYIPLVGWVPAIVILASERFKRDHLVRFHAFQGLYIFVAWLIVNWALVPFFHIYADNVWVLLAGILKGVVFVAWIFMIVKTSQNETYRLPVLGELAERSIAEQR